MAHRGEDHTRLLALLDEHSQDGWEKAWQANVTPWDGTGDVQPPLAHLLGSAEDDALVGFPHSGRALVPGCGRGYDPIFIARTLGLDVLAVDISTSAVDAANQLLAKTEISAGSVTFQVHDFFTFAAPDEERFEFVYEHTFFCAIPPFLRIQWGQQMNNLVKSGGLLIALVYPIDPPREWGPPYAVRVEDYVDVLGDGWELVLRRVPEMSVESYVGREELVVWRKL